MTGSDRSDRKRGLRGEGRFPEGGAFRGRGRRDAARLRFEAEWRALSGRLGFGAPASRSIEPRAPQAPGAGNSRQVRFGRRSGEPAEVSPRCVCAGAGMAWALKLPLADEVIESGLVQDFDASLSGIGQELGAGAYSMR